MCQSIRSFVCVTIGALLCAPLAAIAQGPPRPVPVPVPFATPSADGSLRIVDSTGAQVGSFVGLRSIPFGPITRTVPAVAFATDEGTRFAVLVTVDGFVTDVTERVQAIDDGGVFETALEVAVNSCPLTRNMFGQLELGLFFGCVATTTDPASYATICTGDELLIVQEVLDLGGFFDAVAVSGPEATAFALRETAPAAAVATKTNSVYFPTGLPVAANVIRDPNSGECSIRASLVPGIPTVGYALDPLGNLLDFYTPPFAAAAQSLAPQ